MKKINNKKIIFTSLILSSVFSIFLNVQNVFANSEENVTANNPAIVTNSETKVIMPKIIPAKNENTLKIPHKITSDSEQNFLLTILLPNVTSIIISVAGALSLLFVVMGGIQMLSTFGDTQKFQNAKKTLIYALVGLLISTLSYAIVAIISSIRIT